MKTVLNRMGGERTGAPGGGMAGVARAIWLTMGLLLATLPARAVDPPPDGRHFDAISAGGVNYTKVTVIDISARHVSFRSAQGFATVQLSELDADVLAKLGRGNLDLSDAYKDKPGTVAGKAGQALPVRAREPGAGKGDKDQATEEDDDADEGLGGKTLPFLNRPFEWTMKNIAGAAVMGLGLLAMLAAHCWFIGVAFRTSVGWGIAVLIGTFFAGILNWVFCFSHWSVAKRPVYLNLAGFALIFLGAFTLGQ